MSHKEKCQALFGSVLVILKNVTVIIPVLEGMIYTIWDLVKPKKKEKDNAEFKDTVAEEKTDE